MARACAAAARARALLRQVAGASAEDAPVATLSPQQGLLCALWQLPKQAGQVPRCTGAGSAFSFLAHGQLRSAAGGSRGVAGLAGPSSVLSRESHASQAVPGGTYRGMAAVQPAQLPQQQQAPDRRGSAAPLSSAAEQELNAEERAAITQRLRQKLAERGLLDSGGAAHLAQPSTVARRLSAADVATLCARMKAALRRGDAGAAAQLFDPALLQRACVPCSHGCVLLQCVIQVLWTGIGDDKLIDGRTDSP